MILDELNFDFDENEAFEAFEADAEDIIDWSEYEGDTVSLDELIESGFDVEDELDFDF